MEQAILKTLIWADCLGLPLKAWEIHKWLIDKKVGLSKMQAVLIQLEKQKKINSIRGFYFLKNEELLVSKRLRKFKLSKTYFNKARWVARSLRVIPWIKLVGVEGNVSLYNCGKLEQVPLLVVTAKKRLTLTRFLTTVWLEILGVRSKKRYSKFQSAGKIQLRYLTEDKLAEGVGQELPTAFAILQMKVLWQRDNLYEKYLLANYWAYDFFPNWIACVGKEVSYKKKHKFSFRLPFLDWLETNFGQVSTSWNIPQLAIEAEEPSKEYFKKLKKFGI